MIARRHLAIALRSLTFAVASVAIPSEGGAADTAETWDVGATDVELSVGLDGVGPAPAERVHSAVMLLGYGIVERLSAYLGTTLESDQALSNGRAHVHLGVFGTLVETAHFDLDLFLDAGTAGSSAFALCPSAELNFDVDPERRSWGAYVRVGLPIHGADESGAATQGPSWSARLNPGTYLKLAKSHELLLEADFAIPQDPEPDRSVEVGGLAVGYNVRLDDSIELVNQVFVDVPQADESVAFGLTVGFIATMPSPRGADPQARRAPVDTNRRVASVTGLR